MADTEDGSTGKSVAEVAFSPEFGDFAMFLCYRVSSVDLKNGNVSNVQEIRKLWLEADLRWSNVPRQLLDFEDVLGLGEGYGSQLDVGDDEVVIGRREYFLELCRLGYSVR